MRKTMYSAMKNLAEYITGNESYDFETIWKEWSSKYKPLEETTKELKKILQCFFLCDNIRVQLCKV